jgi:hypothetical protein
MKTYGVVDVYIHVFLASALFGGEWSASRPAALPSGKEVGLQNLCGRRGEEKILSLS